MSDNQRVKEETFSQTSRRGGDGQLVREDFQQGNGWRARTSELAAGRLGKVVACRLGSPTFAFG